MSLLRTGVVATSRKENELRVPIHPAHLDRIPAQLAGSLVFERGYGERFGVGDAAIAATGAALGSRDEVVGGCDAVILPKPQPEDLLAMRPQAVLWGWPHSVQQRAITQAAIDRRLTVIAWEGMYGWSRGGQRQLHVFYKNNELAGYCSVLDALRLTGLDGHYGPPRRAELLSFGSVSRGAAYALLGRGFSRLTVFTLRPPHLVADQLPGCEYGRMLRAEEPGGAMAAELPDGSRVPLVDVLAGADLVVNGTLQDPERPLMYLGPGDEERLATGAVLVDVSCDAGMGFPFARPTSFTEPTFEVGVKRVVYYAVDHSPSYLWDAASWEISLALLPYLGTVMGGPGAWAGEPTIERAVDFRDGVAENRKILSFQKRAADYPHTPL